MDRLPADAEQLCTASPYDFSDVKAVFISCTLKRSPEVSNTEGPRRPRDDDHAPHCLKVELRRAIDHEIATGVWPDMTEHGWKRDDWPAIFEKGDRGGDTIPPQADAGWIGEAGPGPSYLDADSGGPENDFTNRNTTFMTWNLLHVARMLKDAGGFPADSNQRPQWDAGARLDLANPEHRT